MKLLDLYCCGGGAAMGYYQAGFDEVVGVDIAPQPRYPFTFVQGDALEYLRQHGHEFDAVHASPPCQGYSASRHIRKNNHPDLVAPTRELLKENGKPWVIENVPGAPLINPVTLNGLLFGLMTVRNRLFETSFPLEQPNLPVFKGKTTKMGRKPQEGEYVHVVGNVIGMDYCRRAMGIDWLSQRELSQAIPPAYTRWIGERLLAHLKDIR